MERYEGDYNTESHKSSSSQEWVDIGRRLETAGDFQVANKSSQGGIERSGMANERAFGEIPVPVLKPERPEPTIQFGEKAKEDAVSDYSRGVLSDIAKQAQERHILITSTARTPEDQARAMYNNLEIRGVRDQQRLYNPKGDAVIDVYVAAKAEGKTSDQIQPLMAQKVRDLNWSSGHLANPDKLNVIDIAPSSIENRKAFEDALSKAKENGTISKYFGPKNNDPAYHIEIPQPPK